MSEETTATYSKQVQGILDTIGDMKVTELVELKEAFKDTFKVEAAAPVIMGGVMPAGGDGGGAAEGAPPTITEGGLFGILYYKDPTDRMQFKWG